MKKSITLLLFTGLLVTTSWSQVVNTEKIRLSSGTDRWQGNFDLNFGLNRTKAGQTLSLNTNGNIQFEGKLDKWMLLSGYSLVQFTDIDTPGAVPKNFNNAQYAHVRYNRFVSDILTWEGFIQEQWDEIHEIDIRLLTGTGPRFEVMHGDSSQLFLGVLYMYELENNSPENFEEKNRDHRLSTYVSTGFTFRNFIVNHISYYQPNLQVFSDFRINSETSISIRLDRKLSLRTSFTVIFDSRPPATVRQTRYFLSNGVSLSF